MNDVTSRDEHNKKTRPFCNKFNTRTWSFHRQNKNNMATKETKVIAGNLSTPFSLLCDYF